MVWGMSSLSSSPSRRRAPFIAGGAFLAALGVAAAVTLMPAEDSAAPAEPPVSPPPSAQLEPARLQEENPAPIIPEPFDYGECPPVARACVDLAGERAWLQENGEVTYGAVPIGQGGPGYETPRASFHVSRKVIDDVSYVFDMAPMPYAVYFTDVGHAFHEGDPEGDSHGCVRLAPGDAEVYFNTLQVGDLIHIY